MRLFKTISKEEWLVGIAVALVTYLVVSNRKPSQQTKTKFTAQIRNKTPKKILFIGDSHTAIKKKDGTPITYTYPALLKKDLESKGYTIDVLALGGMTTKWMLDNLPAQLKNNKYDRVYIYGGTNDASNSSIKLETALSNIQKMVDLSIENGADPFVIIGYKVEGENGKLMNWRNMSIKGTLLKKQEDWIPYIEKYVKLQKAIPETIKNANFIPPYDLQGKTSDGIHASAEGQRMVADIVKESLLK